MAATPIEQLRKNVFALVEKIPEAEVSRMMGEEEAKCVEVVVTNSVLLDTMEDPLKANVQQFVAWVCQKVSGIDITTQNGGFPRGVNVVTSELEDGGKARLLIKADLRKYPGMGDVAARVISIMTDLYTLGWLHANLGRLALDQVAWSPAGVDTLGKDALTARPVTQATIKDVLTQGLGAVAAAKPAKDTTADFFVSVSAVTMMYLGALLDTLTAGTDPGMVGLRDMKALDVARGQQKATEVRQEYL